MMKKPKILWISTNESVEAVRALEMLRHALELAEKDIYNWKWAILVLDNTLQAFMSSALGGPAGIGALKPRIAAKWFESLTTQGKSFLTRHLDDFPSLYDRLKRERGYSPTVETDQAVEKLRSYRNEFAHFPPKVYRSIIVNVFPKVFMDCLNVVDFIAWDHTKMHWIGRGVKETAREHYDAILEQLEKLHVTYNSQSR